jgi:hypothetical protein
MLGGILPQSRIFYATEKELNLSLSNKPIWEGLTIEKVNPEDAPKTVYWS